MRRAEMKKAKSNELILDYIESYALLSLNYNGNRGTQKIEKHCRDLEAELLRRDILTEDDIKKLNM